MIPKVYRLDDLILIMHKFNVIEIYDPIAAIELGEELVKIGEKMISEQNHI